MSDDIGEIDSVAVDLTFRHLGIARRLTELVFEWFRERGIKTCSLEARPTNKPAIRLYKGMGFQIVETLKSYYDDGSDAYLMRMSI
ncbi:MAG: ribosomal-protein-alanine N-acetyltransferase [Armatimonadetes bacterium CG07_land_8_20_14_0_80_40_9]|nr:MAG: ribosomal-protein-alanine N-acetyltransferase [Armatimonadetes bacterium CG07_land_8_20_14_0_80_40_9]